MMPSAFVLLDALPITPNGKVDRRRLPAPGLPESGRSLVAARNATEERLLAIWTELLGVDRIGVEDDFFALGGHSLLATQAISRVRQAFGVELPLRTFFEAPSVASAATCGRMPKPVSRRCPSSSFGPTSRSRVGAMGSRPGWCAMPGSRCPTPYSPRATRLLSVASTA
jgi:acyl carrier protein